MFKGWGKKGNADGRALGPADSNMFRRRSPSGASASLRFPVAMRPSDDGSWNVITAEEAVSDRKKDDEHIYLRTSTTYEWNNLLLTVLQLPDNGVWKCALVISIVANVLIITTLYSFLLKMGMTESYDMFFYFVAIVTDLMYIFDFTVAMLHNYWQSIRLLIKVQRRGMPAMIIDIITLVPIIYIWYFADPVRLLDVEFWLRAITFLRLYRVQALFTEWANSAARSHWLMFAVRYIVFFCVLSHIIACIWFFRGCIGDCKGEDSWVSGYNNIQSQGKSRAISNERDWADWYLISMYFALTTVCTAGLGDVRPITDREHIICIIGMTLGFCLTTGFYIGSITTQMVNSDRRKSLFMDRVMSIRKHLDILQVSKSMKAHIIRYYETLWTLKRGIKIASYFELLPKPIQMEVAYDINVMHFQSSPLFRNLSESFLRKLSLYMRNEFHLPGSVIYYQNVAKNMMICVASGIIEILSDEDNESPIISFTSGTILGEVSLLFTVPAKATVRAATYTELQVLHKVDFFRTMIDYPQIYSQIKSNIMGRIHRAHKREAINKDEPTMRLFVSRQINRTAIWILKEKLSERQEMRKKSIVIGEVEETKDFDTTMLDMYHLSRNIGKKKHVWMCISAKFPFILEPDTLLTRCWEYFIFAITIFVAFFLPYFIGYVRKFPTWLVTAAFLITVVYGIDLYVVCSTAIYTGTVVTNTFMEILYKRMETVTFYLDLFACIPLEILAYFLADQSPRLWSILFINRLLKVWRVPAFFYKLEKNLRANLLVIRVFKYITLLLIISQWAGVLLYMISCFEVQCAEKSWFYQTLVKEVSDPAGSTCYVNPPLMSMYFGLNLLSGVGYGDIVPTNNMEVVAVCLVMLFGVLIFGWGIAEFSSTFTALGRQRVEYQQVLFAVQQFMVENNILPSIYDRVVRYFQLQWNYNQGIKVVMDKSPIDDATHEIKQAILVKERMDTMLEVPLFSMTDMDYVQLVATKSKILILPPDEVITYAGAISREMYVIQEGYCKIDADNVFKRKTNVMGPNSHFGDIEMLFGIPMAFTVRTVTHCKVISVDYAVYLQAVSLFPFIMQETQLLTEEFTEEVKKIDMKRKALHMERQHTIKTTLMDRMKNTRANYEKSLQESFVNVKKRCKLTGEKYSQPFSAMKKFFWLRFLMLPFCIMPGSHFLKVWAFCRIIAALTIGVITPLQVGISPFALHMAEVINALDVFAYADMYMMLHVGYYDEKGLLITHPFMTAKHYLTTSFILDFLACFPVEFVLYMFPSSHTEGHTPKDHRWIIHPQHCIARLNRVLQLYRLPSAFVYLESDIARKSDFLRILKFLPITFVFINVCAGILTSTVCQFRFAEDDDSNSTSSYNGGFMRSATQLRSLPDVHSRLDKSLEEYTSSIQDQRDKDLLRMMSPMGNGSVSYVIEAPKHERHLHPERGTGEGSHMECAPGTWLPGSHFNQMKLPYGVYIIAYYWVTTTVTSVGFGDITAEDGFELYLVMFMITGGILLFGYMFASISSAKANQNSDSLYQEMLKELIGFLEQEGVDKHLMRRTINHFEYIWRRNHGVLSHMVFNKLPTSIKEDAVLWMYEDTLREVPLFENVEASFFRVIGCHMKQTYFMRGTTIIRSQDVQNNIYIIYRGKVEVLSSYNEMVACMGSGGLFGNIASISASICSVTIVASRNVDALMIPSHLFYQTLKNYPSVMKHMQAVMKGAKDYIMPTTLIQDSSSSVSVSVTVEKDSQDSSSSSSRRASILSGKSVSTTGTTGTSSTSHTTDTTVGAIGHVGTLAYIALPWKWFSFGLLPLSPIYVFMTALVAFMAYVDCLVISYNFAFQENEIFFLYIFMGFESIFYVKILMDLHEGYMDRFGDYVCDNKKIRERFFADRKRVAWAIIPNLPLELLSLPFPAHQRVFVLSMVRLIHILRFKYVFDYFRKRDSLINVNKILDKVVKIFIVLTVVAHICACIWFLLACPLTTCRVHTWAYYSLDPGTEEVEAYLRAIYFIFTVFTTTGYGDVVPHGLIEVSFTIFVMLLSKFFVAIFLGDVTSLVTSTTSTLVNYEYGVNELQDALLNQYVSSHQQEKVWNYVQKLWKHGRGKQMPRFIEQAPYVLQCDVMNAMYGHHLRNSYVFSRLNDDFLRQLTVRLHHFVYFEGNYIVQHGDTDQNMYFIHRGEVNVLTVHTNLTETIHDVLKPGDVFGVAQGLFHGLPHHFSFRAKTVVDIVTLNLDNWYSMLEYFPEARAIIYERAANIYSQV